MFVQVVRRLSWLASSSSCRLSHPRRKPHSAAPWSIQRAACCPGRRSRLFMKRQAILSKASPTNAASFDLRPRRRVPADGGAVRASGVKRQGIELLVGQQASSISAVARRRAGVDHGDGGAPLLDVTVELGGNVDPRQTQELPVNGRNWMELSTLAPGMRANATDLGRRPASGWGTASSSSTSTASR